MRRLAILMVAAAVEGCSGDQELIDSPSIDDAATDVAINDVGAESDAGPAPLSDASPESDASVGSDASGDGASDVPTSDTDAFADTAPEAMPDVEADVAHDVPTDAEVPISASVWFTKNEAGYARLARYDRATGATTVFPQLGSVESFAASHDGKRVAACGHRDFRSERTTYAMAGDGTSVTKLADVGCDSFSPNDRFLFGGGFYDFTTGASSGLADPTEKGSWSFDSSEYASGEYWWAYDLSTFPPVEHGAGTTPLGAFGAVGSARVTSSKNLLHRWLSGCCWSPTVTTELWFAPTDGVTAPRRLPNTPELPGSVSAFDVSPDGKTIAFAGDFTGTGAFELYAIDELGAAPARLLTSGKLTKDEALRGPIAFSPDGKRVAVVGTKTFVARLDGTGVIELDVAPSQIAWSPESKELAALVGDGSSPAELRIYPALAGAAPIVVGPAALATIAFRPLVTITDADAGTDASSSDVSEDTATDVSEDTATDATAGAITVWSSGTLGTSDPILEAARVGGASSPLFSIDTEVDAFAVSPDGEHVAMVAELAAPWYYGLWTTDRGGHARTLIRATDPSIVVSDLAVSPDGRWVSWAESEPYHDPKDLFVAPVGGGPITRVTPDGTDRLPSPPAWSPDGKRLAVVAFVPGDVELGVFDASTPTPTVSIAPVASKLVTQFLGWASATELTVVTAEPMYASAIRRLSTDGSTLTFVANVLAPSGFESIIASPSGDRVAYVGDPSTGCSKLYTVTTDGKNPAVEIFPDGCYRIGPCKFSRSGNQLACSSSTLVSGSYTEHGLYVMPADGTTTPRRLMPPHGFEWALDDSYLAVFGAGSSEPAIGRTIDLATNDQTPVALVTASSDWVPRSLVLTR